MNIKVKKMCYMLVGILLIGICVASFRMSGFGVDPFTCMNLGVSKFIHMGFGTWQLIVNIVLLILVFFTVRNCIGLGTIVNMVFVGYIADFLCWLMEDVIHISVNLGLRILFLAIGLLLASLGAALYMAAEMGIAPYDSVAFIIEKFSKGKMQFRYGRICSDVIVMVVGIVFCAASGNSVWMVVGLGTLLNSMFNGPLIQFFRTKIEKTLQEQT